MCHAALHGDVSQVDNSWPLGPSDLPSLFDWAQYNATILMEDPALKKSFTDLASNCCFHLFEAYAGTGNASTSFKQQFWAMCQVAGIWSGTESKL